MTFSSALQQLDDEWSAIGHGPASRQAWRAFAALESAVAALVPDGRDLGDLVAAMRPASRRCSRTEAASVARAMLRSAGAHPLVPRALLQTLAPGLVTVGRRLEWGRGGDWAGGRAFLVDATATAWEVICAWSGEDRPYAAPDLLSAVRCRLRRQLLAERTARDRARPSDLVGASPAGSGGIRP